MNLYILAVLIVLFVAILDYFWKPSLNYPVPTKLPVVGYFFSLLNRHHLNLKWWAEQYGPVFVIQVFNQQMVVVSDRKSIRELCQSGNFEARNKTFRLNVVTCGEEDGKPKDIFCQDATEHQQNFKKVTLRHIQEFKQSDLFNTISNDVCQSFLNQLEGKSLAGILDPYDVIHQEILRFYYCMVKGKPTALDDSNLKKIHIITDIVRTYGAIQGIELDTFPWLRHFGNTAYRQLRKGRSLIEEVYASVKKDVTQDDPNQGLASAYINDAEVSYLPDGVKACTALMDCAAAGVPVVTTIYEICIILATHQFIQDKLAKEVLAAKGSKDILSLKECKQLVYLQAIGHEAMHYVSGTPMTIRRARVDAEFRGSTIPKDTNIMVNIFAANHNCRTWDAPWVFMPERFMETDGKLLPKDHDKWANIMTFGGGHKVCLNWQLAYDLAFLFTACLSGKFEIQCVLGVEVPYDVMTWEEVNLAFVPKRCQLKFIARK